MAERKGCRFLIEKSAADKVIVPDALELAEGFLALCCQPSEAESCQSCLLYTSDAADEL